MNASLIRVCALLFMAMGTLKVTGQTLPALKKESDSLKARLAKAKNIDSIGKKLAEQKNVLKQQLDSKLKQSDLGKLLLGDGLKKDKKKINLSDFSVENASQYIKPETPVSGKNFLNNLTFNGTLKVYGLPLDLAIMNNYNAIRSFRPDQGNLFKFDVPRPNFNSFFKADLERYNQFKKNVLSGKSLEADLKKKVVTKLSGIANNKLTGNAELASLLNNPAALRELVTMDEAALHQKIDGLFANLKTEIQEKGKDIYSKQSDSLSSLLLQKKAALLKEIQTVRSELASSGLDPEKIALFQKIAENKISQKELETFFIAELSKNKNLSWLQRSYSRIGEFQAGNFGSVLPGNFLNRDLFLNGFNFSLRTARGPVRLGLSTNKDVGYNKDAGFESSTFAIPRMYTYLSVPTTNFSFGSGKLSWIGVYDKQFSNSLSTNLNAVPRNNLVFTVSQALQLKKAGTLNFDISKSSTQYKNLVSLGPDQLMIDRNTNGNYFRDDFFETMSFGVNHAIDSKKMNLKSTVYVNYSGAGFQNPGQQGIGNLNMRFGANIRKSMFKNKLTLAMRTDFKNMPISATDNAHWQNHNIQLDSKIRISKKSTIGLKYIDNGVDKVAGNTTPVYSSAKLQLDLNSSYRFLGLNAFTHAGLAKQQMNNPQTMLKASLIQFNYLQTLLFKGFSVNGTIFYNKELNTTTVMGNMLNTDVSLQYQIFKSVSLSSGITYLDNQHLARQAGIRQNVQFMLLKHFDINAYLDLRKNIISPSYPDLFSTTRAELSIHYYLDRQ
ncbi:hypothetical protein [Pedobacter sp.]|uniref:hypothetical protein n=1 Tax=Pedobacter sp. TaxID=1411316 RepID=UPI003BAA421F